MQYELIDIPGFRTGGVEHTKTIRHSLAFDLRRVTLHDRVVVSAVLSMPAGTETREASSIRLSDPSGDCAYGRHNHVASVPGPVWIALTRDAIADLRQAGGAFFSVDAVFENAAGEPQRSAGSGSDLPHVVVLAMVDTAAVAAAA